jgi:GMP synthase-like glutamine amidotransferase
MEDWFRSRGHGLSCTKMYESPDLPSPQDFDWLVVMGGPMGVNEQAKYPWLAPEIELIQATMKQSKRILGICLGAQLMAAALGAEVKKNPHKEIGWFHVQSHTMGNDPLSNLMPPRFRAFHWHGETFDVPKNARPLGSSEATICQGFQKGPRGLALQYHLELRPEDVGILTEACSDDLTPGPYVQDPEDFLEKSYQFDEANERIRQILEALENSA